MGKALLPHLALREIHRTLKKTGWPGHFPILRREPSLVDLSDKQNVDAVMRSVSQLAFTTQMLFLTQLRWYIWPNTRPVVKKQ